MSAGIAATPTVAVLGASGLIGFAVARGLLDAGLMVAAVARSFSAAQRAALGDAVVTADFVGHDPQAIAGLLEAHGVDVVVNTTGVLQSGPQGDADDVHAAFVGRIVAALRARAGATLLVHVSVPGTPSDDTTDFSRSKREAERVLATSGLPHVILRPGFVVAPAAYGGSALVRALAVSPVRLPAREASAPFAVTAIEEIVATVAQVVDQWRGGRRSWAERWDVMAPGTSTLGAVVDGFRRHLGAPRPWLPVPSLCLDAGSAVGDLVARLGWLPPMRSTALAELRRGVRGDPSAWMAATGLQPAGLDGALARRPATVQELWFARLYLLKGLLLAVLVLFWVLSGAIALFVSFDDARGILLASGMGFGAATAMTIVSSLLDISIGLAIGWRRTSNPGLMVGILVSLGYMAGSAILTPALWVEPLGALVKTGPAIVLMLVALAISPRR